MFVLRNIHFKETKDHRSNTQRKQLRKSKPEKKIQAWLGFEPMTSAIPMQCSYQLSYQANRELVTCWLMVISEISIVSA